MEINRNSKLGCLVSMGKQGFYPTIVIDVGAQVGTPALYQAFPDAVHLMIEPVEENKTALDNIASSLKNAEVIIAAAYSNSGDAFLRISKNHRYSEISDSEESKDYLSEVRKIQRVAIDDVCRERQLKGTYLIKIDVDGRELDVLEGMSETLNNTECVIVETVFFGNGSNNFYKIVDYLKGCDFVIYDIVEPLYRPVNMALWQVDTVFVKENGRFRKSHAYADKATMKHLTESGLRKHNLH